MTTARELELRRLVKKAYDALPHPRAARLDMVARSLRGVTTIERECCSRWLSNYALFLGHRGEHSGHHAWGGFEWGRLR